MFQTFVILCPDEDKIYRKLGKYLVLDLKVLPTLCYFTGSKFIQSRDASHLPSILVYPAGQMSVIKI